MLQALAGAFDADKQSFAEDAQSAALAAAGKSPELEGKNEKMVKAVALPFIKFKITEAAAGGQQVRHGHGVCVPAVFVNTAVTILCPCSNSAAVCSPVHDGSADLKRRTCVLGSGAHACMLCQRYLDSMCMVQCFRSGHLT